MTKNHIKTTAWSASRPRFQQSEQAIDLPKVSPPVAATRKSFARAILVYHCQVDRGLVEISVQANLNNRGHRYRIRSWSRQFWEKPIPQPLS